MRTHTLILTPLLAATVACASSQPAEAPASAPGAAEPAEEAAPAAEAATPAAQLTPPPRKPDADRKSKNGRLEATLAGANVIVQYGRPEVRGRAIFGELIAYGKLWRTGADEATTFTVDADVTVEGKPLAKGTYALFTIPGEKSWTIVFNAVAAQWGAYAYDESKDVLRVEVTPREGPETEQMTFAADGDTLLLRWAKTEVPVTLGAGG